MASFEISNFSRPSDYFQPEGLFLDQESPGLRVDFNYKLRDLQIAWLLLGAMIERAPDQGWSAFVHFGAVQPTSCAMP